MMANEIAEKYSQKLVDELLTVPHPQGKAYRIILDAITEALSHKGEEVKHLTSDQQQAIFNFFHDKEVVLMDDDFNTLEEIIYPRTYPYTLKDEQQEKRYTAELKRIASIVHHGGLLGFITETSAMTEIRKITLPHWDKNEADKLQREAISKLDQFDSEGK